MRIPAFINPKAGSAEAARAALDASDHFDPVEVDPETLKARIAEAVEARTERVLVSGGDGTVAGAAAALAGRDTALAILPGGTLNHFARDHGIPVDAAEAVAVAAEGQIASTDVAYVCDRIFLNTSSVGAYVLFVRARERLERRLGYRLASLLAALRLLGRVRTFTVELEIDGEKKRYRSSMVFIGVGERETRIPHLGSRIDDGRRGLHVIVVSGATGARLVALAIAAVWKGIGPIARGQSIDSFVVDACRIDFRRRHGTVAVDGELVAMDSPLEYRIARDALRIVVPRPEEDGDAEGAASGDGPGTEG